LLVKNGFAIKISFLFQYPNQLSMLLFFTFFSIEIRLEKEMPKQTKAKRKTKYYLAAIVAVIVAVGASLFAPIFPIPKELRITFISQNASVLPVSVTLASETNSTTYQTDMGTWYGEPTWHTATFESTEDYSGGVLAVFSGTSITVVIPSISLYQSINCQAYNMNFNYTGSSWVIVKTDNGGEGIFIRILS
jgi:hypothetical protein